jgi:hypothetical protein
MPSCGWKSLNACPHYCSWFLFLSFLGSGLFFVLDDLLLDLDWYNPIIVPSLHSLQVALNCISMEKFSMLLNYIDWIVTFGRKWHQNCKSYVPMCIQHYAYIKQYNSVVISCLERISKLRSKCVSVLEAYIAWNAIFVVCNFVFALLSLLTLVEVAWTWA